VAGTAGAPEAITACSRVVSGGRPLLCLSVTVMCTHVSAVQMATSAEEGCVRGSRNGEGVHEAMTPLAVRVHGEYREMPGLRLTVRQAARLFSVAPDVADAVLHELRRASVLECSDDGAFSLIGEPSRGEQRRRR
jgi:hypothetical protein